MSGKRTQIIMKSFRIIFRSSNLSTCATRRQLFSYAHYVRKAIRQQHTTA